MVEGVRFEGVGWRVEGGGSVEEQMLSRNVERFRGGLVFKAHRLFYLSTLGSRVTKKRDNEGDLEEEVALLKLLIHDQQRPVAAKFI